MSVVYIDGQSVRLNPADLVGKGGEAYVYKWGGMAVKIFKTPDDPDFVGFPDEQKAAEARLLVHQRKLREFPFLRLPDRVVKPLKLVTNRSGNQIVGYAMELLPHVEVLLRYAQRQFREAGVANQTVVDIFKDLYQTVGGVHAAGVVIGDFNNLNVLVDGRNWARLVDADSMQHGQFLCRLYTAAYVDPRLCDPRLTSPSLITPHDSNSDWFAYTAMLMECLLYVGPWGGIYKPRDPQKRIPHGARPLHGISVFNPEVVYPKPALPMKVLPDDLLEQFEKTFEKGWRGEFPLRLLDLRWTKCPRCGTEHARSSCPNCMTAVPRPLTIVKGNVTATYVFRTNGTIMFATFQDGQLKYLYNEDGKYKREGGTSLLHGDPDPLIRYRICADKTILAKSGSMVTVNDAGTVDQINVDSYGSLPLIDANSNHRYWVSGGILKRDGVLGPEDIGAVLQNQTLFWVGSDFGFGFYRAGNLITGFVFDKDRAGINDSVKLLLMRGQLIDSTCVFARDRCWFFTSNKEGSRTINRVTVIKKDGTVEARAEADDGDGSWLGKIRGKLAMGNFLLSPTDNGIVRVEPDSGGNIVVVQEFPDTEPYVDGESYLLPASNGIYVVGRKEIVLLQIK